MKCRHCKNNLNIKFLDLANAPPSNSYLKKEDLKKPEITYPLRIMVCKNCWLVQTEDYTNAEELFNDEYAYFSSTSSSWLNHAFNYCETITQKLQLSKDSFVVELASNDGYLLRNFVKLGIPSLGIEPTKKTAQLSRELGVDVKEVFFSKNVALQLVAEGRKADLIIGNNVYAHVPDINDFTKNISNSMSIYEFQYTNLNSIRDNYFNKFTDAEYINYASVGDIFKYFDNIMSSISTGIVKINLMGEIEYINDSAIEIFKFNNENLLNNHYAMVFEDNMNLVELIDFAESRNHILYEENLNILKKDRNETSINLTISPVFEEGLNSGSVISFEDLSDINKVKSTFKKYVSENIVDELLLNEGSLELGGVEQKVCVLFSDIRGFTSMSEKFIILFL